MLGGATGSGKSALTFGIIHHRADLIDKGSEIDVIYCLPNGHKISTPGFIQNDSGVKFNEGLPEFGKISPSRSTLLIIDDMMSEINSEMQDLFTRFSHHRSISIIFIVQNIFYSGGKGGAFRTISLNTNLIILMKNPRDRR